MEILLNYFKEHAIQIVSTVSIIIAVWKGRYISADVLAEKTQRKVTKLTEKIEKKKAKMQEKYKNLIQEEKEIKENDNTNS